MPAKNDEVFELRGFDLSYLSRLFRGDVLGARDREPRPDVTPEDAAATCTELDALKRRMRYRD